MSSIEKALYARLQSVAAVTDLVSTRVFPVTLPQNITYPCVSYQIISAQRRSVFGRDTGDVRARIQIDSWGEKVASAAGARVTAEAVRGALQRWSGASADVTISAIFLEDERHEYDDKTGLYRVSQDYFVWYKES